MPKTLDQWAQWLLERRHGGDADQLQRTLDALVPVCDKVLENCALTGDETLLDVGCGDGLIAFGALEQLDNGKVIFSDISQDLLDHVRKLAREMGVADRCEFVQADATTLAPIADESVDAVTMRSVLIYIDDKLSALRSIHRVLKPGGVLSFFEPINRFAHPSPRHILCGFDVSPLIDIADKINAIYNAIQPPDTDPMLNFDERDLLALIEKAGFGELHMEYRVEIVPLHQYGMPDWEEFINIAGNPRIPTLKEAMEQALTETEIEHLTDYLRPKVEQGDSIRRGAVTYIWAVK